MPSIEPVELRPRAAQTASRRPGALSLRALCLETTDSTLVQFVRYTVVGGLAFLGDFFTLFALTRFCGVYYLISAAIAFLVGLSLNYGLSAVWVFSRRTLKNRAVEFGIFAGIGMIGLGLNELGMWLLAGRAGLHYLRAKIVTAGAVYVWNFGARKLALFR